MGSIAAEYRAGKLGEFFRWSVADLVQVQAQPAPQLDRVALAQALREYHQHLGTLSAAVEVQLERLSHPQSRVVVTGQQAGLLTGPSYSVHKGADAVLLSRQLSHEDAPVVPIYWVASQDHDAEEVASTTLLDMSEELHRLTLDLPQGVPVGRVAWQPEWTAQVLDLIDRFDAPAPHKAAVVARLQQALGGSYADSFARLIHGLLGASAALPDGLLVLDPLHPALARLMAPALARELQDPLTSSAKIEEAAHRLQAQGFTPQLRRPRGATNLFLEEADEQRRLLRFDGKTFNTEKHTYTRAQLLDLLEADPTRLTPAAGLRPIVQDTLLPTLAFVVGPGEIAYGAELREVYPLHGLEQPLLWPRLSVTWLEPNVARLLRRLGASAAEVQADPAGVLGRALAQEQGAEAVTTQTLAEVRAQLEQVTAAIGQLDPTLIRSAQRTQTRTLARLAHLQEQAAHALARAENDRTGQLTRLQKHLLPLGHPQEREMNFLTYLLKHGPAPLELLLGLPAGFVGEVEIP